MHPSGYSRAASGWLRVRTGGGPPGTVAGDRAPSEELEEHDRQDVAGASSAGDADSGEQTHRLQAQRLVVPVDAGPMAGNPAGRRHRRGRAR